MAGLLGVLISSAQALTAQSAGLQTSGRNLANVNTPGYARQRVSLVDGEAVGTGANAQSVGVQATGVQSLRDRYLDAQVVGGNSITSMLQARYDAMARAQAGLGESISSAASAGSIGGTPPTGAGVSGGLAGFFNAFQAFSTDPTSVAQKQVLMQSAGALATAVNTADTNLASEQQAESQRVSGDVSDANSLLNDIATLNSQISTAESGAPGSAADLRDQRQGKIESLAQKMNIEVSSPSDHPNQVQISTRDSQGNAVVLVSRNQVLAPLSFDGQNVSAGAGASASVLAVSGGSIAGELQARDGTIADLRGSLKTLAGQLTTTVNAAYNPGGTNANFFASAPAGSQLLQVDPATTSNTVHAGSSGYAGDNNLALAVSRVGSQTFSTTAGDPINGTLGGYYSGVVSNFGAQISGTNSLITTQALVSQQIGSQRDAVSGVSLDEETTNLMQYQRAYQASARVVSVVDSMFTDLLGMISQ